MNKISKILFIIGISFVFSSLLLLLRFEVEEEYSKDMNDNTMGVLLDKTNNLDNDNIDSIVINNVEYVGYLDIPTLELNLAITKYYSYNSLKISPAVYYGSIKNNNLVICGHSYKAHFGNLYKLKKGDLVIFSDVLNNKYIYEVELVEELLPTSIKEMIESDFDLTLYTCTKDALKRVVIRCNMVSAN